MPAPSPLFALFVILCGIGAAHLIVRFNWLAVPSSRIPQLDGLRGLLAFSVFVSHAARWYGYSHQQHWLFSAPSFYDALGDVSVSLFFMVTGFLFTEKLLVARANSSTAKFDWLRLYVSRVLRIFPLYLVSLALIVLIVFQLSDWQMRSSSTELAHQLASWLQLKQTDLNHVADTWLINAGVTWTLPYEWAFYCALPLLALPLGIRASVLVWLLAAWMFYRVMPPFEAYRCLMFLGGMLAAALLQHTGLRRFSSSTAASFVVLFCIAISLTCFDTRFSIGSFCLLSAAFVLMVSGNTFFGVLVQPAARVLGEISYSVYLLHGICLYFVFHFVLADTAHRFNELQHWLVILLLVPGVLVLCSLSYRWIEAPALRQTTHITTQLRRYQIAVRRFFALKSARTNR